MAAVLSCEPEAALSHESAAALWEIQTVRVDEVEVSVPARTAPRRPGIFVHCRHALSPEELTLRHAIPVTTPISTLVDIATRIELGQLEAAINEADKRDLTDPEVFRSALDGLSRRPGIAKLRKTLDRRTFTHTDSELERRFLGLAGSPGLSPPLTGSYVNGFKVGHVQSTLAAVAGALRSGPPP